MGMSRSSQASRSVFVGNIPYSATEEQLEDVFRTVGQVVSFRCLILTLILFLSPTIAARLLLVAIRGGELPTRRCRVAPSVARGFRVSVHAAARGWLALACTAH